MTLRQQTSHEVMPSPEVPSPPEVKEPFTNRTSPPSTSPTAMTSPSQRTPVSSDDFVPRPILTHAATFGGSSDVPLSATRSFLSSRRHTLAVPNSPDREPISSQRTPVSLADDFVPRRILARAATLDGSSDAPLSATRSFLTEMSMNELFIDCTPPTAFIPPTATTRPPISVNTRFNKGFLSGYPELSQISPSQRTPVSPDDFVPRCILARAATFGGSSERWIGSDGEIREDMKIFTFGFGRRACPGVHIARRSVFIAVALMFWSFTVAEDPDKPIDDTAFTPGVVSHQMPFSLVFKPRIDEAFLRSTFC